MLDQTLRLLHPFIPFVTEEIWSHLKKTAQAHSASFAPQGGWEEALITARWPEPRPAESWEMSKVADFSMVQEIIRSIRNLRSEKNVKPSKHIPATLVSENAAGILSQQAVTLAALAQLDLQALVITEHLDSKPQGHIALVVGSVEIFLPLAGLIDTGEERQRLEKDLADTQVQIERLEALLGGAFAQKAPAAVVRKEREKLAGYQDTARKLLGQIEAL